MNSPSTAAITILPCSGVRALETGKGLRIGGYVGSDADAGALHVREADEAVPIGPAPARESYLVADKVLDAARQRLRQGRDAEKLVLARGLRWHLEDRVLVHGNKTVVFPASPGSYASERMG